MSAERLLIRLDGVKQTSVGRWVAKCPAHDDGRASLAVRETSDGTLLVHCFAGCSVGDVVAVLGLTMRDLFPARHLHHCTPERRPFDPLQVLLAVSHEALVVAIVADQVRAVGTVATANYDRLGVACGRIQRALLAVGELPEAEELKRLRRGEYQPVGAA